MSVTEVVSRSTLFLYDNLQWNQAGTKNPLRCYDATMDQIITNQGEILKGNKTKDIYSFVKMFNEAWTTDRLAQQKIQAPCRKDSKPIQFSSFSKEYSWLSNFFPTLIFDENNQRLLHHTEGGYVAFKAEKANEPDLAMSVIQLSNPKDAKQAGSHINRPSDAEAIKEMHRLVILKFHQDPVLAQLLKSSAQRELEEHTNDCFWGTGNGTCYTGDSNQLGKILKAVRNSLISI